MRVVRVAVGHRVPGPLGFALAAEEADLAEYVEDVVTDRLGRLEPGLEESDEPSGEISDVIRSSGLWAHFVPKEYGGAGMSVVKICLVRERLAYSLVSADEIFVAQGIPIQPVVLFGTEEQKRAHLPAGVSGTRTFAFCLSESAAGSDILGINTTAVRTDDGFMLRGSKRYVFQGSLADTLLVFARAGRARSDGLSAFLLDRPATGLTWSPLPLLARGPETELTFTDCVIPPESLLGQEGQGARVALANLDRLRPTVGAAAVGMAQRALDEACRFLETRRAFDRPLSGFQALRFALAEAAAELDAARSLVYGAARFADQYPDAPEVRSNSAKAKLFATEVAQRVVDTALQMHGGTGLLRGSITEQLYRAVRAMRIYEGTSEIMKVVIARSLLPE